MRARRQAALLCRAGQGAGRACGSRDWRLAVVGDGPARAAAEAGLDRRGRVRSSASATEGAGHALWRRRICFVWPAINEAYGLALLEAQAAGLPVVAGRQRRGAGYRARRRDRPADTPDRDAEAFAGAVRALLTDHDPRARRPRPRRGTSMARGGQHAADSGRSWRRFIDAGGAPGMTAILAWSCGTGRPEWNARRRAGPRRPAAVRDRRAAVGGLAPPRPMRSPARWAPARCARHGDGPRCSAAIRRAEPRLIEMDWGDWEGRTCRTCAPTPERRRRRTRRAGLDFRPRAAKARAWSSTRLRPLPGQELGAAGRDTRRRLSQGRDPALYALADRLGHDRQAAAAKLKRRPVSPSTPSARQACRQAALTPRSEAPEPARQPSP